MINNMINNLMNGSSMNLYLVTLGPHQFRVRARNEEDSYAKAFEIWMENEDVFPEPCTGIKTSVLLSDGVA